jgi:hypothetical protein
MVVSLRSPSTAAPPYSVPVPARLSVPASSQFCSPFSASGGRSSPKSNWIRAMLPLNHLTTTKPPVLAKTMRTEIATVSIASTLRGPDCRRKRRPRRGSSSGGSVVRAGAVYTRAGLLPALRRGGDLEAVGAVAGRVTAGQWPSGYPADLSSRGNERTHPRVATDAPIGSSWSDASAVGHRCRAAMPARRRSTIPRIRTAGRGTLENKGAADA